MGKSKNSKKSKAKAAPEQAPAAPVAAAAAQAAPQGGALAATLAGARALVFDLDGVLVSTDKLKYESYRRALDRLGTDLSLEFYKTLIGLSRMATCQAIVDHCRLKISPKELADLREAEHPAVFAEHGVAVIPAARKLLAVLPRGRFKLGLVSSSTRDRVEAALEVLDFDFDSVVSGENVPPKPAPDIYLKSFRELGVRAAEAAVFEDSENGVAAAVAAGARCVAVPAEVTLGQDFSEADLRIASLNAVREMLL
jgi:HAD superfamily hydrolase (TIGR01509 family)